MRDEDWSKLGGDPTPGEVAGILGIATSLRGQAMVGAGHASAAGSYALGVGSSAWHGRTAEGFLAAFAPLPAAILQAAVQADAVASALESWASDLTALQAQADELRLAMDDTVLQREAAERDLTGAEQRLRAGERALRQARIESWSAFAGPAEQQALRAAHQARDAAVVRVDSLTRRIAALLDVERQLKASATSLAERHQATAAGHTAAVQGATVMDVLTPRFSGRPTAGGGPTSIAGVAQAALADGVLTAGEVAAFIAIVSAAAYEDVQLHAEVIIQVVRQASADPGLAEAVVVAVQSSGVVSMLAGVHAMGEQVALDQSAGHGPTAVTDLQHVVNDLLHLLAVASQTPAGAEVLTGVVDVPHHDPIIAILTTVAGMNPDVAVAVTMSIIPALNGLVAGPDNALFPGIAAGVTGGILTGLAGNPEALLTLLFGPADDPRGSAGVEALLQIFLRESYDSGTALAGLGHNAAAWMAALADAASDAQLAFLIPQIASAGLTPGLEMFQMIALAPAIVSVGTGLDGTELVGYQQLQELFKAAFAAMSENERHSVMLEMMAELVATNEFDSAVIAAGSGEGDVIDHFEDIWDPLFDALESVAEDEAQEIAALEAALADLFGVIPGNPLGALPAALIAQHLNSKAGESARELTPGEIAAAQVVSAIYLNPHARQVMLDRQRDLLTLAGSTTTHLPERAVDMTLDEFRRLSLVNDLWEDIDDATDPDRTR